jgi:hypothetical protein
MVQYCIAQLGGIFLAGRLEKIDSEHSSRATHAQTRRGDSTSGVSEEHTQEWLVRSALVCLKKKAAETKAHRSVPQALGNNNQMLKRATYLSPQVLR